MDYTERVSEEKKVFHFKIIFSIIFIILIFLFVAIYMRITKVNRYFNSQFPFSLLLVGESKNNAEVILLFVFHPKSKRLCAISFSKDFELKYKGVFPEKINNFYRVYGINKMRKSLETLIGTKILFFVIIDKENFIKLVDIIDGIKLFMQEEYYKKEEEKIVHLPFGINIFEGSKVVEYLQYPSFNHQFDVIFAVLIKRYSEFIKKPKLLKHFLKYVKTNIFFFDVISFLKNYSGEGFDAIEFFSFSDVTKSNLKEEIKALGLLRPQLMPSDIKIQVLNGCGKKGAALLLREKFVRNKYRVLEFGNADRQDYEQTLVLCRSGDFQKAKEVASAINCKNIIPKIDKSILVDVTVIIGKDFYAKKEKVY